MQPTKKIRPLRKLAPMKQVQKTHGAQNPSALNLHEDLSTGASKQLPQRVEFAKRSIVTRFAPSPTGVLHTGSARTALYNWLFAKRMGGEFKLRIEDTDLQRSKPEHVQAIIDNLHWLGLHWDGDIVFQLQRKERHAEVAEQMLQMGSAYLCFATPEEIEAFRSEHPNQKYHSPWRDADSMMIQQAQADGLMPTVRLKVEHDSSTSITDLIVGSITVDNKELDDMVMLRSDGTPTYMLAVVVDDHDMEISHVIRGDDHLTNAFRQKQIYQAMGWSVPKFAHLPLIHSQDGKKLSKRREALGIDAYHDLGYLPEAVNNHLLRLGFGHGDEEIITMPRAIEIFSLNGIGKSPAKFDMQKLNFINAYYMRAVDLSELFAMVLPLLPAESMPTQLTMVRQGLDLLRQRSHTLHEIAEGAQIFYHRYAELDEKSQQILKNTDPFIIQILQDSLKNLSTFTAIYLKEFYTEWANSNALKLPTVMQLLRALLLGTFAAPGIFEVMEILGPEECLNRIGGIK